MKTPRIAGAGERWKLLLIGCCMSQAARPPAAAGEAALYFISADKIVPVSSPEIDGGAVIVRDGLIEAVGKDLAPPAGAVQLHVPGWLLPGLIDCGSTLGLRGRAAEEFVELSPEVRAADGIDLDDRWIRASLAAGVTSAAIVPGERNVIGGLGAVISLASRPLKEAVIRPDAFLAASLTAETAAGNMTLRYTPPLSIFHRLPTTRMGTVFLLRRALMEAAQQPIDPDGLFGGGVLLTPLLNAEGRRIILEGLGGRLAIRIRADEEQEIIAALRLVEEFRFQAVIEGFTEGSGLIPQIVERKISVLIPPGAYVGALSDSNRNRAHDLAAQLERAGASFAFFSDRGEEVPRLRERAAIDVRFGLSSGRALRALTLDAAAILGIDGAAGSLEAGKRADLAALSGDPFLLSTRVLWTMAAGEIHRTGALIGD